MLHFDCCNCAGRLWSNFYKEIGLCPDCFEEDQEEETDFESRLETLVKCFD